MPRKRPALRMKAYTILEEAIEEGVSFGLLHAYKHSEEPGPTSTSRPSRDAVVNQIVLDVMNALSEVVDWEKSG